MRGVLLAASAAYHVDELAPLGAALAERGMEVTYLATRASPDAVVRRMATFSEAPVHAWPRVMALLPRPSAVVVLNDWGPTRDLIELANSKGVPTFAKVEGVQDFDDVDTGRVRRPYRHAGIVLGQGANDVESLRGCDVRVVGNERLEQLLHEPEREGWNDPPVAVLNSNFTYGVLEEAREGWLTAAIAAVREAGAIPLISQHPAEPRLGPRWPVADESMDQLLARRADLLVSRFSTVPFEAMARGVPFIYFNQHGERVPTFSRPQGAFQCAATRHELVAAIDRTLRWRGSYRKRSQHFFEQQVDVDRLTTPANRSANVILSEIRRRPPT